jgi:hypothetical protein
MKTVAPQDIGRNIVDVMLIKKRNNFVDMTECSGSLLVELPNDKSGRWREDERARREVDSRITCQVTNVALRSNHDGCLGRQLPMPESCAHVVSHTLTLEKMVW